MNFHVVGVPTGWQLLVSALRDWGVVLYAGVTGGGVIHFVKHLPPTYLEEPETEEPSLFTIGEYVAGFVPLGYYLCSGRVAAALATTGAATKLLTCALSDAKLHNIPCIFIVPVNSSESMDKGPLQDASKAGSNIVAQLEAELPDAVFLLDDPAEIGPELAAARRILDNCQPVVLLLHPETMAAPAVLAAPPRPSAPVVIERTSVAEFLRKFPVHARNRRIIVFVGEEASRYPGMHDLTTRLCKALEAPVVWSINGANAVARSNPYAYGYIAFGGNDRAMELWRSITPEDIVLALGFCPDEYTLNLKNVAAGRTWNFTNLINPYGHSNGGFSHRVGGDYAEVRGALDVTLAEVVEFLEAHPLKDRPQCETHDDLNSWTPPAGRKECVDIVSFYRRLDQLWRPRSIGFDDVCLSYKDRQYVTQRPHPHISFHSLYRGSAMGGAFGLGIGAKLAEPGSHVFVFTGDGCFRLFAGCLAEATDLGLTLFVLNNETYGIVEQGLKSILPNVPEEQYHAKLRPIDFCGAARAYGWEARSLKPDLGNLNEIIDECYIGHRRSLLVEVPIDASQIVGPNPRVGNL